MSSFILEYKIQGMRNKGLSDEEIMEKLSREYTKEEIEQLLK